MMLVEPLIVVAVLAVVAALALLYGVDTRPQAHEPPWRWFGDR